MRCDPYMTYIARFSLVPGLRLHGFRIRDELLQKAHDLCQGPDPPELFIRIRLEWIHNSPNFRAVKVASSVLLPLTRVSIIQNPYAILASPGKKPSAFQATRNWEPSAEALAAGLVVLEALLRVPAGCLWLPLVASGLSFYRSCVVYSGLRHQHLDCWTI